MTPAPPLGGDHRLGILALLAAGGLGMGPPSALVQRIGCGHAGDDWCGFGSGSFGVIAFAVGGTIGMVGAVLWLVTRRTAALA